MKLKHIILSCCIITALWTEIQGMDVSDDLSEVLFHLKTVDYQPCYCPLEENDRMNIIKTSCYEPRHKFIENSVKE